MNQSDDLKEKQDQPSHEMAQYLEELKDVKEKITLLEKRDSPQKEVSLSTGDRVYEELEREKKQMEIKSRMVQEMDEYVKVHQILKDNYQKDLLLIFEKESETLQEKGVELGLRNESCKVEVLKFFFKTHPDALKTSEEKLIFSELNEKRNKEGIWLLWNIFLREQEDIKSKVEMEKQAASQKNTQNHMDQYEQSFFKGIKNIKNFEGAYYA